MIVNGGYRGRGGESGEHRQSRPFFHFSSPSGPVGQERNERAAPSIPGSTMIRHGSRWNCPKRRISAGMCLVARSEEQPSELQSLMLISYAVFCLQKKRK